LAMVYVVIEWRKPPQHRETHDPSSHFTVHPVLYDWEERKWFEG